MNDRESQWQSGLVAPYTFWVPCPELPLKYFNPEGEDM